MNLYATQLRACSEVFQQSMYELQQRGVAYYDDRAYQAARDAIATYVPDVVAMSGGRVGVEAELGVALEGKTLRKFGGVAVNAVLHAVDIQELHEVIEEGGVSIELVRHDLCGLFVPVFVDPDPVELVFGDELYVPFGAITQLDPAV